MKKFVAIAALLLFFIVCLLVKAPAWLLTTAVDGRVAGLQLGTVSGSLWRGRLEQAAYNGVAVSGIDWQLRPLGLLTGRALSLSVDQPLQAKADIGLLGTSKLRIFDLQASGSFAPLLDAVGLPTMGFDGRFSGAISRAVLERDGCETVTGDAVLESISGDIDGIDSIAPVGIDLGCNKQQLVVTVDGDNPAQVRGVVQLAVTGRASGNIQISPPPGSPLFRSLSQFVGRPQNGKDFQLRL